YYYLGSGGKVTLDFETIVDWYPNDKKPRDYPDPIGDRPRKDLAVDCVKTAYDRGYFQGASKRSITEFAGVFLVNDMDATAVTWYEDDAPEIVMADGTAIRRPIIMSDVNHLNHHNVLAHELGHGFLIYHAGSGF